MPFPAESLEFVLRSIAIKDAKEPKLLSRIGTNARGHSSANNDVGKSISLLRVLHGIVWSFPKNMGVLLKKETIGALLLKTIVSPTIPITVRETLLSMVSSWCILYHKSFGARNVLESIVDSVKQQTGLTPSAALLPLPPVTREQEGWPYPPPPPPPQPVHNPAIITYNGMHYAAIPLVSAYAQPPHIQPAYTYNSFSDQDPVVAVQQQALIQAQNASLQSVADTRDTQDRGRSLEPADRRESSELTPTFIEHMEKSAQELKSLCDMLTENLISLNVEEDPRTNSVVDDMRKEVDKRKTAINNFMSMLTQDNMETLQKLSVASEEVDRCKWLYDNTLSAHNEWKAIQESLKTSAAEQSRMRGLPDDIYPSSPFLGSQAAESSNAANNLMAAVAASRSGNSGADTRAVPDTQFDDLAGLGGSHSSSHGMSGKAKGKMAEVPSSTDYYLDMSSSHTNNAGGSGSYSSSASSASSHAIGGSSSHPANYMG
ncbi:hypothetical protein GGI12_000506 [Dipsacomyces acuminosporus]|nr:hypothetical protein GGI12_000506 [Dipsacomyces acuminosporus]